MRREAILDLLLLEADGGLSAADAVRLEDACAGDPGLQAERRAIHAAWRELQALGSAVAMPPECGADEIAAVPESDALELMEISTRHAPTNRIHAPAPARRRRRPPRNRR
jgi:hypothetical protein